jgi:hypothetical protein
VLILAASFAVSVLRQAQGGEPGRTADPATSTTAPVAEPVGPEGLAKLIADCNAAYDKIDGYTCTFRKQEAFEGVSRPAEVMEMKFRKPHTVHLVWQNGILRNRQVLYDARSNGGKILVYTGNLPAFHKVFRLTLDSVEVTRENRHSISQIGMGYLCVRLNEQFEQERKAGKPETKYTGLETVDGRKTWHVARTLEDGGRREWNIDVELLLPTRVATFDKEGKPVETYSYSDVKINPGLKDEDFDPDKIFF